MLKPEFLKANDKIGIIAPARSVDVTEIETAVNFLKNHGLNPQLGPHLFGKDNQFSGSDQDRASDIQEFLDDPEIKAIFCARGGYGSARLLPLLNWEKFKNKPKWFVGYSDITVFHMYINNMEIATLHAPMAFNLSKEDFNKDLFAKTLDCLFGNFPEYCFAGNCLNIQGKAKGKLIGGNLSVIYSLRGTPTDIKPKGSILFVEDIDEYLYHIDRMMLNLKYGGVLGQLRGILVGGMTDMKDNNIPFGKDAYEIIASHAEDLGVPVGFGFPAGHDAQNEPLILGSEIVLEIGKTCSLKYV